MMYFGPDPLQRKHRLFTEQILTETGGTLWRIASAYRFENDNGGMTHLLSSVPGLGQLAEESEALAWQEGVYLINKYYKDYASTWKSSSN